MNRIARDFGTSVFAFLALAKSGVGVQGLLKQRFFEMFLFFSIRSFKG